MADLQFALDFAGKLPPSAQEGMAQALENANQRWVDIFLPCVLAASRRLPEITSDDVLAEIEMLPNAPSTHNLSAIGPVMILAAKKGYISRTDKFVRSKRPEKHGNLGRAWRSNYFTGSRTDVR